MAIKIGGPRNFYNDVNVKKLGLDKAAKAINDNTDRNAEQDDELDSLDDRVTALENAPQPQAGVSADVIADAYEATGHNPEYEQGDVVLYNNGIQDAFYEALVYTTAEPGTDHDAWQAIHIEDVTPTGVMVPAGGYVISNDILYHNKAAYPTWFAPNNPGADFEEVEYSVWAPVLRTYEPGEYATYADELYVCTAETSGAFDPSDWTKITVMSQVTPVPANRLCPEGDTATDGGKVVTFDGDTGDYYLATPAAGGGGVDMDDTGAKKKIGEDQYGNPIYQAVLTFDPESTPPTITLDEYKTLRHLYSYSVTGKQGSIITKNVGNVLLDSLFNVENLGSSLRATPTGGSISSSYTIKILLVWSEEEQP